MKKTVFLTMVLATMGLAADEDVSDIHFGPGPEGDDSNTEYVEESRGPAEATLEP